MCRFVQTQALVEIDEAALKYLASELAAAYGGPPVKVLHWLAAAPASVQVFINQANLEEAVSFLTLFHAIGFCYWGEPRWTFTSYGTTYNGSLALLHSLRENLYHLKNLAANKNTNTDQFSAGLGGVNRLCLLPERLAFFRDLTRRLQEGELTRLLQEEDCLTKAFYIEASYTGFQDTARIDTPQGKVILPFLKRAQLLVSDIDYLMRLKGGGGLPGADMLTAFADYKVPQLLREAGALIYSPELSEKVDTKIELTEDSLDELSIRASTIVAVDKLKRLIAQRGVSLSAAEVDNLLWLKSQKEAQAPSSIRPYHRTMTCRY